MTKNLTLALVIGGAALLTFLYVQRQAAAASITTAPVSVSPLSALVSGIGSFLGTLPLASGTASNSDGSGGLSQDSIDAMADGTYGVPGI
ncbi:MAG: hypothetical protein WCA78_15730 [Rhizomicrobium sp.]